jgi:hypothetical protein
MSDSDLNTQPTWHETRAFAPRPAPTCRCADHEALASRNEDGDWTCCTCGRPVKSSVLTLHAVRSAICDFQLRAA